MTMTDDEEPDARNKELTVYSSMELAEADESQRDREKETLAAEAFERIRTGQHWRDWMFIADGLMVGRFRAQRRAGTDNIQDPKYRRALREWMDTRPWAGDLDNPTRNHAFWCADHRSEIEAWRETLEPKDRDKLNHPTTVKRRYEATHLPGAKTAGVAALSPMAKMKESIVTLEEENLRLRRQAERDGSLFDLRQDSVKSIVETIAGSMSLGRFESMQREMTRKLAELKTAERAKTAKAG